MYKQRFRSPNLKDMPKANYAHIRYIATRPRVMRNKNMSHGLFGKLEVGGITEFSDWKDVACLSYANSRNNITMYRSIISFRRETAGKLMLNNQKDWQRYVEKHILTIARQNSIKVKNLCWTCAAHNERGHPHVHIAFWDKSAQVRNPYTHPAIPDKIRKQLIKDTFPDKIRAYGQQKDMAVSEMRLISDQLVDEFEQYIRLMDKGQYKGLRSQYALEEELSDGFDFDDAILNEVADRLFKIKVHIPPKGRIAYKLLPPKVKAEVDGLVQYIIGSNPQLKKLVQDYVQAKLRLVELYTSKPESLQKAEKDYQKEAEKIIANRILGAVKTLFRIDSEMRSAEYAENRGQYYASQLLYEIFDLLSGQIDRSNTAMTAKTSA